MAFRKLTPNIMVDDINKSIAFYRNVLDFELVMSVPEKGDFEWAMMRNGETEIMFQTRANLSKEIPALKDKPVGGALSFYIDVDKINKLYGQLKDKITVVQDIHTTFYGAVEFTIEDCNGYLLTFAESSTTNEEENITAYDDYE